MDLINMQHGSGGMATDALIKDIFEEELYGKAVAVPEDAAVLPGSKRIAVTTDSFVVTPEVYPGGDIGRLCVCGTVNDLLMRGAQPRYLTCGFVLQTGLPVSDLKRYVHSLSETAKEAGIQVAAGDTKVVEGTPGLIINTTGVGFVGEDVDISAAGAKNSDVIIVSGDIGRHHAAIMTKRLDIKNTIESDNAPLTDMVTKLIKAGLDIHTMRDVTRGGLATILKELAVSSGRVFEIEEELLPVDEQVEKFCGLLGLEPVYMGCEGRMVVILPEPQAGEALDIIRSSAYGENAALIGRVRDAAEGERAGWLIMKGELGTSRFLSVLQGEGLPRIC